VAAPGGRVGAGRSPADTAERSDIVIGCLQTVEQYEKRCSARMASRTARAHTSMFMSGRPDAHACADLGAALAERGIATLDAPMSGGVAGARAGTLVSMVAGPHTGVRSRRAVPSRVFAPRRLSRRRARGSRR
jgi:3-hydroxyisobutyrate dehydrogenase-like beta-hydroxyacid dehydrogenase